LPVGCRCPLGRKDGITTRSARRIQLDPEFQMGVPLSFGYVGYPWAERKLRSWVTNADPLGQPLFEEFNVP